MCIIWLNNNYLSKRIGHANVIVLKIIGYISTKDFDSMHLHSDNMVKATSHSHSSDWSVKRPGLFLTSMINIHSSTNIWNTENVPQKLDVELDIYDHVDQCSSWLPDFTLSLCIIDIKQWINMNA